MYTHIYIYIYICNNIYHIYIYILYKLYRIKRSEIFGWVRYHIYIYISIKYVYIYVYIKGHYVGILGCLEDETPNKQHVNYIKLKVFRVKILRKKQKDHRM